MVRRINIEGVVDELPESGFSETVPPAQNEKIIGLFGLLLVFLISVDWGSLLALLPFQVLGTNSLIIVSVLMVLFLRFVMTLIREPVGGATVSGYYCGYYGIDKGKNLLFYDMISELFLVFLFGLLVWLRNPIVFGLIGLMLISRFKSGQEEKDWTQWYPQMAN